MWAYVLSRSSIIVSNGNSSGGRAVGNLQIVQPVAEYYMGLQSFTEAVHIWRYYGTWPQKGTFGWPVGHIDGMMYGQGSLHFMHTEGDYCYWVQHSTA